MKRFWSRYRLEFPRVLIYMLQTSEYHIGPYLRWYLRMADFRASAQRKQLVPTAKSRTLLAIAWLIEVGLVVVGLLLLLLGHGVGPRLLGLVVFIFYPEILALLITIPLLVGQLVVQKPRQRQITDQARAHLKVGKAFKIAIAGSYGKTSFKTTLAAVLAAGLKVAASPDSYNTPLGLAKFVEEASGNEDVLVFEFGESHTGDIEELSRLVQPDAGVITGINEAHLETFGTLEKTTATIFELADFLGSKPTFLNGGDARVVEARRAGQILYDRKGCDGWKVTGAETGLEGTSFIATKDKRKVVARSKLLGLHQVGPLVACIAIAERLGLTDRRIELGVAATEPFAHRLQPHIGADGVVMLDDSYNGNPDGVRVVIEFLASLKQKRRIYITPGLVGMGDRTAEVHRRIGRELADAGIEQVLLIKNSVTPFIVEGLRESPAKVTQFNDMPQLLAALPSMTRRRRPDSERLAR